MIYPLDSRSIRHHARVAFDRFEREWIADVGYGRAARPRLDEKDRSDGMTRRGRIPLFRVVVPGCNPKSRWLGPAETLAALKLATDALREARCLRERIEEEEATR